MTPRHYVLTLTGAAQQLSAVLPDSLVNAATPGVPASGLDRASKKFDCFQLVTLQADAANAGAIFLGGDDTVSSTNYGIRIPAAVSGVPAPPLFIGPLPIGRVKLEEFWVVGSANEKLYIFALEA